VTRTGTPDEAAAAFGEGFNCAQAVFAALAPRFGLDGGTAARTACAFGGGMARSGGACGAVTGALMAIGLARGGRPSERDAKEAAYGAAREFMRRFGERNGAVACRDLLGCEIGTPEGYERAKRAGSFDTLCPKLVRDAVEILEELLSE